MRIRSTIFIIIIVSIKLSYSQTETNDTIKCKFLFERNDPMIAVTIYVKDSKPPYGTMTNTKGEAELYLSDFNQTLMVNILVADI